MLSYFSMCFIIFNILSAHWYILVNVQEELNFSNVLFLKEYVEFFRLTRIVVYRTPTVTKPALCHKPEHDYH